MAGLGYRRLRIRAGSFVGVFVMIAITATIAAAAGQIMSTALGAPGPGRFATVDALVRANPTVTLGHGDNIDKVEVQRSTLLPVGALERVKRLAGVHVAVGDVAFPVTVIGRGGVPLPTRGRAPAQAHGWPSAALTPYRLASGRAPASGNEMVLDEGLVGNGGFRIGDLVHLVTPAGPRTFRLVGVVNASRAEQERQASVFLTQSSAQALSGLGPGFNAIGIRFAPGADHALTRRRIAAALGGSVQVLDHRHASAGDAGDPRAYDRVQLVAVVAASGGMTLAISIFVLAGTVAFAAERRRREIALLRAIGATPGQVRALLVRETATIGLLAGAAGCVAANALSGVFVRALTSVDIAPEGFAITLSWIPYAIAVGVGAVVAVLATLLAARRALAVRPGEALVESGVPSRRLSVPRVLLGMVALAGGLTLVIVLSSSALSYATLAAFVFMIAVALLGPLVLGWPTALAGRALLAAGGAGFLAGSGLAVGRFRVGAVGAAVALVVALTGTQVLTIATAQHAAERVTAGRVQADYVLSPTAGGGLPPALAREAAQLPGATAVGVVETEVFLLDHGLTRQGSSWNAAGLDPAAVRGTLALDVESGSLDVVRGRAVAVSATLARAGDLRVGSVLHARLADAAPAQLRVVAIYRRANGLGDVVLSHRLALKHAAAALDSAVFVDARGARATGALFALARLVPTAAVRTRSAYLSDVTAQGQQNARAQWVVAALMIVAAVMAALNAGVMSAAGRRHELALARLCGATRRQVISALALESALTIAAGLATGAIVAVASLAGAGSDPNGGPLVIPLGQASLVLAGAVALGLLGTLAPAALIGPAPLTALPGMHE